jgi:hypothetical protein
MNAGNLNAGGRAFSAPRTQKPIARAWCHACKNSDVNIRADDTLGEHRLFPVDGSPSKLCEGSGQKRAT